MVPPLAIDWFDNSVYFGCQVLFRTRDRGQSWQVISPDLSTGDPSRIRFSGGVVGDNLGQFYGALISAIAPSRTQKGVVWVGTNDGKVWISRDAGAKWNDLTANVKMPKWGLVRRTDASHFDPGTAYVAVDYHLVDNRDDRGRRLQQGARRQASADHRPVEVIQASLKCACLIDLRITRP